jgi:serine phosphatase RsbU (regulator of sigma subunit)/tetratricopeptide (TPR) repeat protein
MKRAIGMVCFFFFILCSSHSQNRKMIDSLYLAYQNAPHDSIAVLLLYDLAREYRHSAPDSARFWANKGLALAQKANFKRGIALHLNVLGIVALNEGDYVKALTYLLDGLKINEEIQNPKDVATNLNNIGEVYRLQGNTDEALNYYQKALIINEKSNLQQNIAINLNNIGEVYQAQGKYTEALVYLGKSLKICEQLNDQGRIALRLNNIGEIYAKQGDLEKAKSTYQKALLISKKLDNKLYISIETNNLARIYLKNNNLSESLSYANTALATAKTIKAKKEIATALQTLTDLFLKKQDYKQAFEYNQQYNAYKDSLNSEEANRKAKEMQFNYEISKKEKEIELLEKEKILQQQRTEAQTIYTIAFAGGSLLLLLLAMVLFQRNQTKRKSNELLQEKNGAIEEQKEELHKLNEEIEKNFNQLKTTSDRLNKSIQYANHIQQIILPSREELNAFFEAHFCVFLPKDTVSGDFYWFNRLDEHKAIFAMADCTGHGVPGAFMSMVGSTLLHETINIKGVTEPARILRNLHAGVRSVLKQETGKNTDGMDIAICYFEKDENTKSYQVTYAGAKNSIFYVQNEQNIIELEGDKVTIGGFSERKREFSNFTFHLQKGDMIYFASDGYADQHNHERKRFGSQSFKAILEEHHQKNVEEQQMLLLSALKEHQQDEEQRDDITIVGLRL